MKYLISFLFLVSFLVSSGQPKPALPDDVVKNIEKRIAEGIHPSVVIGIVDKNGPRYYNFGLKSKGGSKADEHTIYEIGSITKVFTAILLAQQVLEGNMKLDDPIKKYLPADVKVPTRGDKEITLGNLSDHTSGLPRMPTNFTPANSANPYVDYTVEQMYAFLSGYELTRDIGSAYEYSNLAQGLLGHILALKANVPYETVMLKNIAAPLGMRETRITFDEKMKKNLAIGHDNGDQVSNWDLPTLAGAGGIRSSTSDMLKFLQANMGLIKTSLQPAIALTQQVRHDKAGGNRVGLGWHIAKNKHGDIITHSGGTGGYRTFAGFIKETGVGVVVMTNSTEGVDDIGLHLLDSELPLRNIKPAITAILKNAISTKGTDAAIAELNELKKTKGEEYDFSEDAINTLGYTYMDKNVKAALGIFKLNVEWYPNSSNVYDSYGEALLKDGQTELAIENYKKSVQLNPGNTGGIKALEKLGVKVDAPQAFEVKPEVLEKYVGTYELVPGFNIVITREGNHLFEQATGQGKFEIYASNEKEFYMKVVNAQILFNVNDQGVTESMTLVQNGQRVPGKKIK